MFVIEGDSLMGDVAWNDLLAALLPRTDGIFIVLDILLYLMFFLNLLAFFMQSDKQIMATMLMGAAMLANIVGKLSTYFAGRDNPIEYLEPTHLAMLIVNCGIFVIPLIVAGMSKAKRPKPLTIISGVMGGFYFGMFWFFLQVNMLR
jgi:predicted membrane-bound dolichyl-phosphate-mannose-protein mannosyltransferase